MPVPYEPVYIGSTLTSPWASVIAQNAQGDVQVLASFVTEAGGLRYHVEQQVTPWLRNHARFVFSNRQNLCGCYDDNMDLLQLQTLYASLEDILKADWNQSTQTWDGRREAMHALLNSVEHFTFRPKFQVSSDAVLIAQSFGRKKSW